MSVLKIIPLDTETIIGYHELVKDVEAKREALGIAERKAREFMWLLQHKHYPAPLRPLISDLYRPMPRFEIKDSYLVVSEGQ